METETHRVVGRPDEDEISFCGGCEKLADARQEALMWQSMAMGLAKTLRGRPISRETRTALEAVLNAARPTTYRRRG